MDQEPSPRTGSVPHLIEWKVSNCLPMFYHHILNLHTCDMAQETIDAETNFLKSGMETLHY